MYSVSSTGTNDFSFFCIWYIFEFHFSATRLKLARYLHASAGVAAVEPVRENRKQAATDTNTNPHHQLQVGTGGATAV